MDRLPPSLKDGTLFGRYRIVRRIGRGGMGAVFEGMHSELQKRVAIKALLPPLSENPDLRARFVREGQAASRIRHPHVVDIYDVGVEDGISFLVMEYLEGEDLNQLLKRETRLSMVAATDIMLPVVAAIGAAHDEGVIHRDLKPANIFLADGPYGGIAAKVLDFGISKIMNDRDRLSDGLTNTGAVLGTPYYMSPEQAVGGRAVDMRSDQYSLGVILYQMLTGRKPFDADSMYSVLHKIVEGTFPEPRGVNPEISERVEAIVLRAMSRSPEDRFPSVRGFGAALLPYGSDRARALWEPVFAPAELEPLTKPIDVLVPLEDTSRIELPPVWDQPPVTDSHEFESLSLTASNAGAGVRAEAMPLAELAVTPSAPMQSSPVRPPERVTPQVRLVIGAFLLLMVALLFSLLFLLPGGGESVAIPPPQAAVESSPPVPSSVSTPSPAPSPQPQPQPAPQPPPRPVVEKDVAVAPASVPVKKDVVVVPASVPVKKDIAVVPASVPVKKDIAVAPAPVPVKKLRSSGRSVRAVRSPKAIVRGNNGAPVLD